jgi:hypothetical protein
MLFRDKYPIPFWMLPQGHTRAISKLSIPASNSGERRLPSSNAISPKITSCSKMWRVLSRLFQKPSLADRFHPCRTVVPSALPLWTNMSSCPGKALEKLNPSSQGFLTATDLADELVRRGVSFAEAHEQAGMLVRYCVTEGRTFQDLSAGEAGKLIPSGIRNCTPWPFRLSAPSRGAM